MNSKHISYVSVRAIAVALAVPLVAASHVRAEETSDLQQQCHLNVNTDSGKGGWQAQQCGNSASVGVSGPIRDVDIDHPFGKGKAFIPQAGRDIEAVAHGVEHGAEKAGKWISKRLRF